MTSFTEIASLQRCRNFEFPPWANTAIALAAVIALKQYFDKNGNMETLNAAELLAALGHESRLAIFRLLVEAGPEGMNASAIAEQVGLPGATLSFHLSHLTRVGLIKGERESRFIHYSAQYDTMDDLIAFLTSNCCQGQACLPKTASCNTAAKRRAKTKS